MWFWIAPSLCEYSIQHIPFNELLLSLCFNKWKWNLCDKYIQFLAICLCYLSSINFLVSWEFCSNRDSPPDNNLYSALKREREIKDNLSVLSILSITFHCALPVYFQFSFLLLFLLVAPWNYCLDRVPVFAVVISLCAFFPTKFSFLKLLGTVLYRWQTRSNDS